jgi:lipopolysaccharide biosynthesis glycosyltransferase
VHGRYYKDCLVKLRIFELVEYARVIYVDADSVPLKSLDHLFTLPFDEPVAAPRADWLPSPCWASHLLVVKPSHDLWNRVEKHFECAAKQRRYDMDIINAEFAGEIATLPDGLVCLNSEWEDVTRPGSLRRGVGCSASVIHFTALGKPWSYRIGRVRRLRPNASPFFYQLWEMWWNARDEIFMHSQTRVRLRHLISKCANQLLEQ